MGDESDHSGDEQLQSGNGELQESASDSSAPSVLDSNVDSELRKGNRDRKLSLKAKESKVIELSHNLVKIISKQLEENENFLQKAHSLSNEEVDNYAVNIDGCTQSVCSIFQTVTELTENKVNTTTQTLFDQFIVDTQFVHDYFKQRKDKELQDEKEMREAELALDKEKRILEEEMKQLESSMSARRARMRQLLNTQTDKHIKTSVSTPTHTNSTVSSTPIQTSEPPLQTLYTSTQSNASRSSSPNESQAILSPQAASYPTPVSSPDLLRSPSWQKSSRSDTIQPSNLAQEITDHMHISLIAPPEPSVFTGDPLEYADWRVSFDSLVGSKRGSPIEKLHRLRKYVDGDAKDAISGYFRLQTSDAYMEALDTLKEEFGKDDLVEDSFRDKLEQWPRWPNRDSAALKRYSYFLRQCLAAQRAIPKLQSLDEKRENKKIIKVLPGWLATRWAYYVTKKEEKGRFPPFANYVEFITREAKVSTNSIRDADDSKSTSKKSGKEKSVRALQTSATSSKNCLHCQKGPHSVTECRSLASKSEEDRNSFVKEQRLCFGCMNPGHPSKHCTDRAKCGVCGKAHPTVLHRYSKPKADVPTQQDAAKSPLGESENKSARSGSSKKTVHATKQSETTNLLNMILPVYVSSGENEQLVYALLDTQSDASFITSTLASQIKPSHTSETVTMSTLHGESTRTLNRHSITIRGYGRNRPQQIEVQAYEQGDIPCNRIQIPNKEHIRAIPHFEHILKELPPKLDIPIGILLGVDCSAALAPQDVVLGNEGEAFAMRTILGWTLCGKIANTKPTKVVHQTTVEEIEEPFNDAHDLGSGKMSQNDMKFLSILEEGVTRLKDGSLSLPLPFKETIRLPNNRKQAERRLEQLFKRLKSDSAYQKEYCQFMKEMIDKGHAELAPEDAEEGKTWYIPHFGVYHNKKKKLRVVFDASANYREQSLNDHLLTGPDVMNSLVGILLRFRKKQIGISCDIEKMFYNFHVSKEHRDYLRFLWTATDTVQPVIQEYRMTRHLFGASSSPGVATFALRKIAKEYGTEMPKASSFIIKDFYVDDGITSVDSVEEAEKLVKDATQICATANLRLHKFLSNDRSVLQAIPAAERVKQAQELDLFLDKLPSERTLGLEWSVNTDTIRFLNNMNSMPPTRRGILSAISQLYDPLGLLAPFTLEGKLISQEACREKGCWDEEVSSALKTKWEHWSEELNSLATIIIPRCIAPKSFGPIILTELHHFSDASLKGYGACSYIRLVSDVNEVHTALLMAKSRVVPLKPTTIPRLELQAALEAVKLSCILKTELDLNIDQEYFWTDSAIALGYIRNSEARYHMFVANRVQEIRENSKVKQWHHVAGKENPADLLSRGTKLLELNQTNWWTGPDFLNKPDISTHLENEKRMDLPVGDPEVKKPKPALCIKTDLRDLSSVFGGFSSWSRLVKAIANVTKMFKGKSLRKPHLTTTDLFDAEQTIIRLMQRRIWKSEVDQLSKTQPIPRQSTILKLSPFLDEHGLLRVGGRVQNSSVLTKEEKHPLIVAKNSPVAKLLAAHFHQKVHHQGQTTTLAAIRSSGYWMVGISKIVKDHIGKCIQCKMMREQPLTQLMGQLPQERVEPSPPFTHIGIDCFGPYTVKDRRTELKRWGLIVTCMYSRAVHVEMLESMTADSLINALRRLICIRGAVRTVFCDNGTNFTGASNELNKEHETMKDRLQREMQDEKIQFKFNAPGASHAGGAWERQIRTIKSVLDGMVVKYKSRMSTEALRTAFYEAMYVVNNRPLSVANLNDPTESVVTPNHLITMKSRQASPLLGHFDNQEVYGQKMWRKVQMFAEEFQQEWKTRYIAELTKRQKWELSKRALKSGDLVLIVEDGSPRNQWPLAVVEETMQHSDELPRRARIRVANRYLDKNGKRMDKATILERPIRKLILVLPGGA